jgi:hypothetical protein
LMICGTNPNIVNEAAAMPNTIHNICFSFYSSLGLPVLKEVFFIPILSPTATRNMGNAPLPACRSQALHRTPLFSTAWDDDHLPSSYPRPMKGIWVARMVINCTFASNGRLTM